MRSCPRYNLKQVEGLGKMVVGEPLLLEVQTRRPVVHEPLEVRSGVQTVIDKVDPEDVDVP